MGFNGDQAGTEVQVINNERITREAAFNFLLAQAEELRMQFHEVVARPEPNRELMRSLVARSQHIVDEMEALCDTGKLPKDHKSL